MDSSIKLRHPYGIVDDGTYKQVWEKILDLFNSVDKRKKGVGILWGDEFLSSGMPSKRGAIDAKQFSLDAFRAFYAAPQLVKHGIDRERAQLFQKEMGRFLKILPVDEVIKDIEESAPRQTLDDKLIPKTGQNSLSNLRVKILTVSSLLDVHKYIEKINSRANCIDQFGAEVAIYVFENLNNAKVDELALTERPSFRRYFIEFFDLHLIGDFDPHNGFKKWCEEL